MKVLEAEVPGSIGHQDTRADGRVAGEVCLDVDDDIGRVWVCSTIRLMVEGGRGREGYKGMSQSFLVKASGKRVRGLILDIKTYLASKRTPSRILPRPFAVAITANRVFPNREQDFCANVIKDLCFRLEGHRGDSVTAIGCESICDARERNRRS